jgi:hypothetical protein
VNTQLFIVVNIYLLEAKERFCNSLVAEVELVAVFQHAQDMFFFAIRAFKSTEERGRS